MASRRRFRWGFVLLGAVLIALVARIWILSHQAPKPGGPPPVAISVAQATVQDVTLSATGLGAAQAWKSDIINTQINGMLTYVAREGTDVAAGALLAQIDCSPYRAALTQAEGALKRDRALLEGARVNLARYRTLAAQDSIASQQLDDQAALAKQDAGTVEIDEGTVAAAQVNVRYCRITSPVAGRVGVRLIDPGNIVSTSITTGIVSVNEVEPIAVTFSVPQGDFLHLSQVSNGFTRPLTVEALSQDTGASLGLGQLMVADNHVDPSTGTIELKAQFPNTARTLWPGQFINVRITLQTLPRVTVIPVAAVNQGPNGAYAYVVDKNNKVTLRPITVQTTQDAFAVIQSGVSPGETVVTDGQLTLKSGMTVAVRRPPAATKAGG